MYFQAFIGLLNFKNFENTVFRVLIVYIFTRRFYFKFLQAYLFTTLSAGHSGRILCMCVTRESQYLVTGSEDTSVIVWDLHTLAVKIKML